MSRVSRGLLVPGLPQPLLAADQSPHWLRLREGFEAARDALMADPPDVLVVYSTMWPSVIGHQIQADPEPEWVHVDELFHDLGSIPYRFRIDAELAHAWVEAARGRGLQARAVAYPGFPIDTGSVVALKLLNPDNAIPAIIVSSNVYADRAETIVLAKALNDALEAAGKRAAAAVVMTLSNRVFTDWIDPREDRVHSQKDDEWNRKILEFLAAGRLEDVAQLSRSIHRQIRVKKVVNFKPMWFLSALMGAHNRYDGTVHAYGPLYGTGAAVVSLTPSVGGAGDKEYDEDDVEHFQGDRNVLDAAGAADEQADAGGPPPAPAAQAPVAEASQTASGAVRVSDAPAPVGAYPHARRVGDLLYLSGMGPRQPGTDAIPGGPIRDADGQPLDYDVAAQTRAVIENVQRVLAAAGSSLDKVVDVTVFLVDMDRDFADFNAVYAELLGPIGPTRTTVAVRALPTPIAVELKVVALP